MNKSTELTVSTTPQQLADVEAVALECRQHLRNAEAPFQAAFALAAATRKLEALITDEMMTDIMALQGSPLGFRTDKDIDKRTGNKGPGYPVEIVRPAAIEAMVRGFRHVNNEWNIIAGRFYGAKTGFERVVKTYPGLVNFEESVSVPERAGARAFVSYLAVWSLDGEEMRYERTLNKLRNGETFDNRIVVRVNEGMLDDAILGKAHRKAYAGILARLDGHIATPDGEIGENVIDADTGSVKGRRSLFAETDAKQPSPEDDPVRVMEGYISGVYGQDTIRGVGTVVQTAAKDTRLQDEQKAAVREAGKIQTGKIKSKRGEGSNKTQKEAFADAGKGE